MKTNKTSKTTASSKAKKSSKKYSKRVNFPETARITVLRPVKWAGSCVKRGSLLKNGMKVATFTESFAKAKETGAMGFLGYLIRRNVIAVK